MAGEVLAGLWEARCSTDSDDEVGGAGVVVVVVVVVVLVVVVVGRSVVVRLLDFLLELFLPRPADFE